MLSVTVCVLAAVSDSQTRVRPMSDSQTQSQGSLRRVFGHRVPEVLPPQRIWLLPLTASFLALSERETHVRGWDTIAGAAEEIVGC